MAGVSAVRIAEGHARAYRYTWKGSAVSAFLNPLLFLLAMGVGLGDLVDDGAGTASLDVDYIEFLAPGLLAATVMQVGAGEGAWPVLAGIKWRKNFYAMLATPATVDDVVVGGFLWATVRLFLTGLAFAIVTTAFGVIDPHRALLALLPAVLTGMAFVAPMSAHAATLETGDSLSTVFRFAIIPMFLFSGTFYPVDQLPELLRPVAWVTPLWHGVELCRAASLGTSPKLHPIVHVAYLLGWFGAGWLAARRTFTRRLVP